jgi:hypothetical protein
MKKPIKTYYILYVKSNKRVFITTYRSIICRTLKINLVTFRRHLKNVLYYETEEYIIWKDISIHKRVTGLKLRRSDIRNTSPHLSY